MADQEEGICGTCGNLRTVSRKYYHYEVECDCCRGDTHFVYVYHCSDCVPKAPTSIRITLEMEASDKGQEF